MHGNASVTAGKIRLSKPPMPDVGSQPSSTAKIRMSIAPSQNCGSERPTSAKVARPWSRTLPGRRLAPMPSDTPTTVESTIANPTSSTVFGNRSKISSLTGELSQ